MLPNLDVFLFICFIRCFYIIRLTRMLYEEMIPTSNDLCSQTVLRKIIYVYRLNYVKYCHFIALYIVHCNLCCTQHPFCLQLVGCRGLCLYTAALTVFGVIKKCSSLLWMTRACRKIATQPGYVVKVCPG